MAQLVDSLTSTSTLSASVRKAQTDPMLKNRNYMVTITQDRSMAGGAGPVFVYGMVPESFQFSLRSEWSAPFGSGLASIAGSTIGNLMAMTGNRLVAQVMTMQVWQGSSDSLEFVLQFELRAWSDAEADVANPLQTLMEMSLPSVEDSGFLRSPGPIIDPIGVENIAKSYAIGISDATTNAVKSLVDAFTPSKKDASGGASSAMKNGTTESMNFYDRSKAAGRGFLKSISDQGLARKKRIEENMTNKIQVSIGRWFHLDNVVITDVQADIKAQTPETVSGIPTNVSVTVSFRPVFALTAEEVTKIMSANVVTGTQAPGLAGTINATIGRLQGAVSGLF